jgi:hypothetical protein
MKKISIAVTAVCLAVSALAASPNFKALSKSGNAASPSEVIFPASPGDQLRIVNANWNSDTNNAVLSFSGGSTAFNIVETNQASTSVTNKINSTNGLAASSVLVLQHGGVCYAASVSTWNASTNSGFYGGTNVVLASGGWGVNTSVGDNVFLMDTPVTLPIGATTNAANGDAIYVATLPGRPVRVVLTPAFSTNKLNAVVGRYE